ncbi:hypothetical protein C8A05DRAFT_46827 [Staphylotrichum tortipilum]|uniref:Uncharacterized protein n=1 Tax=Staphylotrichum tortipilum TaxID=2831512 RepID=A0AAN6MDK6_9PEZI|nr:hypothetical protein C8A05DRAFT_46827 [Staphylotrichum longicolle]
MSLVKPLGDGRWPVDSVDSPDGELCRIAADFFVSLMPSQETLNSDDFDKLYRGPGIRITAKYLTYWLVDKPPGFVLDNKLASELAERWLDIEDGGSQNFETYVMPIINNCTASVCQALGWEGNSDLAGIGVFSSYYIEAILITIYLIPLIAIHFGVIDGTDPISSAFKKTLRDMVQSVYVFSIAVMTASLYTIIRVSRDGDLTVSRYDIITSIMVSILATCPATALYAVGGRGKGPQYFLRVVLLVMWGVMLAIVNLGQRTDPSIIAVQQGKVGQTFDIVCEVMGKSPLNGIRIFSGIAAAIGIIWLLVLGWRTLFGNLTEKELEDKPDMKWGRFGIAFLSWGAMWAFVGLFTLLRARIIMVSGSSNKSNEWNFGQIVALATWVPVIISFIGALFGGCGGLETEGLVVGKTHEKQHHRRKF